MSHPFENTTADVIDSAETARIARRVKALLPPKQKHLLSGLIVEIAWIGLLLLMAFASGQIVEGRRFARHVSERVLQFQDEAASELAQAREQRRRADADLARARALLQQAEAEHQRQSDRGHLTPGGRDAGQVSSL